MKEKDFQASIKRSVQRSRELTGEPIFYYKIPDLPRGPQTTPDGDTFRFNSKKPFDFILAYNYTTAMIESKIIKGTSGRVAFNAVREHQEDALKLIYETGNLGLILIHFRLTPGKKMAAVYGDEVIKTVVLPITGWEEIKTEYSTAASASFEAVVGLSLDLPHIPLDPTDPYPTEMWDLQPLLEAMK